MVRSPVTLASIIQVPSFGFSGVAERLVPSKEPPSLIMSFCVRTSPRNRPVSQISDATLAFDDADNRAINLYFSGLDTGFHRGMFTYDENTCRGNQTQTCQFQCKVPSEARVTIRPCLTNPLNSSETRLFSPNILILLYSSFTTISSSGIGCVNRHALIQQIFRSAIVAQSTSAQCIRKLAFALPTLTKWPPRGPVHSLLMTFQRIVTFVPLRNHRLHSAHPIYPGGRNCRGGCPNGDIPLDRGRFVAGTVLAGRYRIIGLLGKGVWERSTKQKTSNFTNWRR